MDNSTPPTDVSQRRPIRYLRSLVHGARERRRAIGVVLTASVIASGLIGITAPLALADDEPAPTPTSQETETSQLPAQMTEVEPPVVADEAPAEAPAPEAPAPEAPAPEAPAPEAPAPEAPAPEKPATEAPTAEKPATEAPATPAPEVSATDAPTPPAETSAPEVVETPAPKAREAATVAPLAVAAAVPAESCGTDTECGRIDITNVVSGGTATSASWTLTATSATRIYTLTSGVTSGVSRPDTYTVAATPVSPAIAANYVTTFECDDLGSRVTADETARTLTYSAPPSGENRNRGRTAECTFTHTYSGPANATIRVKVGGDRTALNQVSALAGVTLRLHAGDSEAPGTAFSGAWATCVSDATGWCTFTVPNMDTAMGGSNSGTSGGNKDRRFWVKAVSAPSGWFLNTSLNTGVPGSFTSRTYAFRTPALATDMTVTSGTSGGSGDNSWSFMNTTSPGSRTNSGGVWAVSRTNPLLGSQCGVDVALLVDLSGSLSGQLSDVKSAATSMVDALEGTASSIGVYTFAEAAPASAGGNLGAQTVSTAAGAQVVRNHINTFTTPSGGTNWDAGLAQIPANTYKAVVIVTDGNPTFYGAGSGNGSDTRFVETEKATFAANRLKAGGSRVIALGVGDGVAGAGDNLKAVSGTDVGSYYQASDFTQAKTQLRSFALANCLSTVSVVKQVVPSTNTGENITGAAPAGGWDFTATPGSNVSIDPADATATTDPEHGAVSFPLNIASGSTSGNVTITEAQQAGFNLVTQNGKNAVCTARNVAGAETPVSVTNAGNASNPGFTVSAPASSLVTCTVYNRKPPALTSIVVDKAWSIDGAAAVPNDQNPLASAGVSASLSLDGTGQQWGTARGSLTVGSSVRLTESVTIPANLTGCTSTGVKVLNAAGATVATALPYNAPVTANTASNRFTIVNSLSCETKLTLNKSVLGGEASPNLWTLKAQAPAGALAGPTGRTGVTTSVTPATTYVLSEADGPATYKQSVVAGATLAAGATGSWVCTQIGDDGDVIGNFSAGANGTVTVPRGTHVSCTAENRTAELSLLKHVITDNGGEAVAADFDLKIAPAPLAGLSDTAITGAETTAPANTVSVRPGHVYSLTESPLPGYANTAFQRKVDGEWVTVTPSSAPGVYPRLAAPGRWEVVVDALASAEYRFVNDDIAPTLKLVKTVVNNDGGTATAADWTLKATPATGSAISMVSGGSAAAHAGVAYDLSETGGPAGYDFTTLVCDNGDETSLENPTVTLAAGTTVTCTFTNDDRKGSLTLKKVVVTDDGGDAVATDWNGKLIASLGQTTLTFDHAETKSVAAGTYSLTEEQLAGYTQTKLSCAADGTPLSGNTVSVASGANVVCTFTNDDIAPKLTLVKVVANENGGTAVNTAWQLSADADGEAKRTVSTGTTLAVTANRAYELSETGPAGYSLRDLVCTGAELDDQSVTLSEGQQATCTFTNVDSPATLVLKKVVINDDGGDRTSGDWDGLLTATGTGAAIAFDHGVSQQIPAGTYTLAETQLAGYTQTNLSCTEDGTPLDGTSITLGVGESVECTFTNDDVAPTLTLVKEVVNSNGGTALPVAWELTANAEGQDPIEMRSGDDAATVRANLTYTLAEQGGPRGYTWTSLVCDGENVTSKDDPTLRLAPGQNVTCTFTNTDAPATLTLKKMVVNDNGGTAVSTDWNGKLTATRGDVTVPFEHAVSQHVAAGVYTLAEDVLAGYTMTDLSCTTDGAPLSGDTLTLAVGDNAVCTFTNDDVAPTMKVIKTVINDDGGTAEATDWTLTADAEEPVSGTTGDTLTLVAGVEYTLTETGPGGYDLTALTCTATESVSVDNPTLTLAVGESVECEFVNDDRPGTLTLNKVVVNDNGGTAVNTDWNAKLTATTAQSVLTFDHAETKTVAAGSYVIAEQQLPGYAWTALTCTANAALDAENNIVTVGLGQNVECSLTNDDVAPTMKVIKTVINDDGGTAEATDWTLTADAEEPVSGTTGDTLILVAGVEYTLTETGPGGYDLTALTCTGTESVSVDNPTLTLAVGESVECEFVNDDRPGKITLNKVVVNDNGGDAVDIDWNGNLLATQGDVTTAFDHGVSQTVPAGVYDLSEVQLPGYEQIDLTCVEGVELDGTRVTVANGESVTCTFTNDDIAPTLTLIKVVENVFGGDAEAGDWTLTATTENGPNVSVTTGTTSTVSANALYVLDEDGPNGYELTDLRCESDAPTDIDRSAGLATSTEDPTLSLNEGENATCWYTNTELPGTLTLHKVVADGHGGDAVPADWNGLLAASRGDDQHTFDDGETKTLPAGTYDLSELEGYISGYDLTRIVCDDVEVDLAAPQVTLERGADHECTFTNTAQPGTLILIKEVDNSEGGSRSADEWTLGATADTGIAFSGTGTLQEDGTAVISGPVLGGKPHTLFETGPSGYTASEWFCDDNTPRSVRTSERTITVAPGETVICRIVNTGVNGAGSVDKTVVGATQHSDGIWTVVYRITVQNESDDREYRYDLADELRFGGGITIDEATWSGDGRNGVFADDHTAVLAEDAVIPAGATASYLVTVKATVSAGSFTDGGTLCYPDGEEVPGGGFLNRALLSENGGEPQVSEACAEPIAPTVNKTGVSAVRDAETGNWTLTYRVTVGAAVEIPAGTNVDYSLTESPEIPASFALVGNWTATAAAGTPAPTQPSWDGTGAWQLVDHGQLTSASPTREYLVSATVTRTSEPVVVEVCDENDSSGVVVWNNVTLTSGELVIDDTACVTVDAFNVSLTKTAVLPDGLTSVEPGDSFRYDLVVTNHGSQIANDVHVTDTDLNDRLRIDGVTVTGDVTWDGAPGFNAEGLKLTLHGLAPGASATVGLLVTFLAAELPAVAPQGEADVPDVVNLLENTACVAMEGDENADDNCDDADVPTRDLVAMVYTRCVGDAPHLGWTVRKSELLKDLPISFHWAPDGATATTDPADVSMTAPGGTTEWSESIEWPGAAFTPSGVSIDYPGWRELRASDYAPDGGYYMPGTTTVMTPEQELSYVFNGLILDDSELDYVWRFGTTITFSVNPTVTLAASYPAASPTCFVPRHTELEIEKTPSVETVKAGEQIDYTIDVHNVSDDSAANNVVVTDEIPATLKVTDVSWAGKGDADAFPNWRECDITGSDANGFGGMLTCTLFGPLQPVGAPGISEAPQLRLAAEVAASASGEVVNVAVVDYNTFDDLTDVGRASDDAVTTVLAGPKPPTSNPDPKAPLAATGSEDQTGALWLAGLLLLLGAVLLRRHRAHKM